MLTTKAIENFFQGKKMTGILAKLDGTAGNLDRLTGRFDEKVSAKKLDEILGGTLDSIKEIQGLLASVKKDFEAMKLPETASQYRAVARDAAVLSDNLHRASASLDQLLERLKERPSDLFFGKPPEKRWNE
jgi:phospholipid/cholesterol/gamma-HCH transport system substrate-binding protein